MISSRLAPAAVVLFLLALVPTWLHSYVGYRLDDGLRADAIAERLAGLSSRPSGRKAAWVKRRFDSENWTERWYGPGDVLSLFVARSYDPKRLYHHPELAVSYPRAALGPTEVRSVADMPGIPVFVLRGADGPQHLVVYALLYDGRFVGNPYLFQFRMSGELLVGGRKPMTLFYVHDGARRGDEPLERTRAVRLLHDAIASFEQQEGGRASTTAEPSR